MRKILTTLLMAVICMGVAFAQESKQPQMTFEKTTHDFGQFKETDGPQTCIFKFTNTGNQPLVIYQAIASCGCTIPIFPKEPIKAGEKGEIKVTYNGKGKRAGEFEKYITIRTNAKNEIYRLKVTGSMVVDKK